MNGNLKLSEEAFTFDDVLLLPAYSTFIPSQAELKSRFSKNININIPLVSAAMDTVTESAMAIALAQEGGIGILHKNCTVEEQARMVRKVKRAESGMISDPVTLSNKSIVQDALNMMEEYSIGGIPVVNNNQKLVGIVTNRDLRFEKNMRRPITEVMTSENLITSTEVPSLNEAEAVLQKYKIEKLPVVNKDFALVGLITYKDILKVKQKPNASKDHLGRLKVAAAVGIATDMADRVEALANAQADAIVVDTAHGHSKGVIDAIKAIRKKYKKVDIVVGNVATGQAAIDLAKAGADGIKVGIGPGSICTTRVVAGVGVPQLTAIDNVVSALRKDKYNIPVIADGGIRFSGDITKALAAGADCVMLGSLFAGTEESPGETIIYEGRKFKTYRGMGSIEAMQKGSKDRYFQAEEVDARKLVPEGIVGRVPYKGPIAEIIYQLVGGIKAGMGYVGAKDISQLKKAKFVKVTHAGAIEGHPHNIVITREAPNYSRETYK